MVVLFGATRVSSYSELLLAAHELKRPWKDVSSYLSAFPGQVSGSFKQWLEKPQICPALGSNEATMVEKLEGLETLFLKTITDAASFEKGRIKFQSDTIGE